MCLYISLAPISMPVSEDEPMRRAFGAAASAAPHSTSCGGLPQHWACARLTSKWAEITPPPRRPIVGRGSWTPIDSYLH